MRVGFMRALLYAALAVGCGGTVGGLWTDRRVPAAVGLMDHACGTGLTCGALVATSTGTDYCQTTANCKGNNDGSTFSGCLTSPENFCKTISGASKTCGGTCQDAGAGPCTFTLTGCSP